MKTVALILLMLCLLQPLACFANPCDSCFGSAGVAETSGEGRHTHDQDSDSCDTTVCCEVCIEMNCRISLNYTPSVSVSRLFERNQYLPQVVIPIFVPPQSIG